MQLIFYIQLRSKPEAEAEIEAYRLPSRLQRMKFQIGFQRTEVVYGITPYLSSWKRDDDKTGRLLVEVDGKGRERKGKDGKGWGKGGKVYVYKCYLTGMYKVIVTYTRHVCINQVERDARSKLII